MSDDELILLCTPLRLKTWSRVSRSVVRTCVTCGSQLYVSPSAVASVDSGRMKPRCIDHPSPDDAVLYRPFSGQRRELRDEGLTHEDIEKAHQEAQKYLERMRRQTWSTSSRGSDDAKRRKPDA